MSIGTDERKEIFQGNGKHGLNPLHGGIMESG